ncbi:hypothetical protein Syun_030127 [Stephania yunnanensis]|uniref:Uncharacterized protein n=1 Tax=Stephania yunnanensis TaxID=152371 RepID=A0AAP0HGQ4_9MAGN
MAPLFSLSFFAFLFIFPFLDLGFGSGWRGYAFEGAVGDVRIGWRDFGGSLINSDLVAALTFNGSALKRVR